TLWWPLRSRPFSTLKTACGVLVASLPNSTTPHIATVLHPCQADQSQKGGPLDAGPEPIRISEQAQGQDHRTRQRPARVRRLGEGVHHFWGLGCVTGRTAAAGAALARDVIGVEWIAHLNLSLES